MSKKGEPKVPQLRTVAEDAVDRIARLKSARFIGCFAYEADLEKKVYRDLNPEVAALDEVSDLEMAHKLHGAVEDGLIIWIRDKVGYWAFDVSRETVVE